MKSFFIGVVVGIVVTCAVTATWRFYKELRAWSRPHVWQTKDIIDKANFCEIPEQAYDVYCFRVGFQDQTEFVVFKSDLKTCWESAAAHVKDDKPTLTSGTTSVEKRYIEGPVAWGSAYAASPWSIDDRTSLKMASGEHRFAAVDESTGTVYLCGWNQ